MPALSARLDRAEAQLDALAPDNWERKELLARWLNALEAIYGDGAGPPVRPDQIDPAAEDARWETALASVYGDQ